MLCLVLAPRPIAGEVRAFQALPPDPVHFGLAALGLPGCGDRQLQGGGAAPTSPKRSSTWSAALAGMSPASRTWWTRAVSSERPAPLPEIRELRLLPRHIAELTADRTRYWPRLEKPLEDALCKLASAVSTMAGTGPPARLSRR